MSAARTNAERSSASPTYDLNRSPSRNLPGRPMAPSLLESRCAPGSLLLPVRRLRLSRTCVILNGHIWSLTWADVDTAHLMFWRHGAVRRGADAAREDPLTPRQVSRFRRPWTFWLHFQCPIRRFRRSRVLLGRHADVSWVAGCGSGAQQRLARNTAGFILALPSRQGA